MRKKDYYYDFLPSNLEIIEKSPSPLGGIVIYILSFFIIVSIIMSMIFKMDIIITTPGVVDSEMGVNIINTNKNKKIVNILKKQGDYVIKDDVILELEDTNAFEKEKLDKSIKRLELELLVIDSKISREKDNEIFNVTSLDNGVLNEMKKEYSIYWEKQASSEQEYHDDIKDIDDEIAKNKSSPSENIEEDNEQITNLEERKTKLAEDFKEEQSEENFRLLQQKNQINEELLESRNQFELVKKDSEELQIKAPVDGQILEASYSTIGEYTNPQKDIAKITPNGDRYIVKASIKNENISQIKKDQSVKVKVNSYDYQIYGFLNGKVVNISENAVLNETTQSLEYPIEIEINIKGDSKIKLKSGMQVTMDIKTGRKTVFDYFTAPIRKTVSEAF